MYKKIIILLNLFLITRLLFSQGGWFWQSPLPQGNNLNNSYWVNSSTVYVAGDRGTIIKSTNKGNNWQLRQIPTLSNLKTIRFFTPNIGIAAGSYGTIYRTKDGGISWNKIDSSGYYYSITASHFIDANSGYLLVTPVYGNDSNLVLLKTTDSGISWKYDTLSTGFRRPFDFKWFSADTIYVLGQWNLYKSINHGMNWISIINANYYGFNDMYFLNSNTGWIASSIGHIKKTTDGGISWDSLYLNLGWGHIKSMKFSDENIGFFSGDWNCTYGVIYKTQNGGINWNRIVTTARTSYFLSISICDSSVLSVGLGGVFFKSSNYGNTWDSLGFNLSNNYRNAYFINDNTGWVLGGSWSGVICKTTDGGYNWIEKTIDNQNYLRSLFFLNENTGWAGNKNKIFKTTDAGSSWYIQFDSAINNYTSIYFINENTGWAAGEYYNMFKTTNGGITWFLLPKAPGGGTIYFINENTGWSALYYREIYKTTDGGLNWNRNTSILWPHRNLYKIQFLNEMTGIVCADGGMFRSSNGGDNWYITYGGEMQSFYDFCMLPNGFIKAIGEQGLLITSKDSGISWVENFLPTNQYRLNSIFFSSDKTGWVFGGASKILKTTTGGEEYTPPVIPEKYFLYQNYPNPFNNSTKIRFDIPDVYGVVNAKLYVYDILGREVVKLFDENVSSGSYSISWNASNFASGTYFYRLTAGDYSSARKMVLVK